MTDLRLTAILKTDLRDSTPLFHSLTADRLREFLNGQKSLISDLIVQGKGQVVKGEGDAFWAVFPSVTAAVQTAMQIQQGMQTRQVGAPDEHKTALRIVIAAGDILHHANDIFGGVVNLAARIEGVTPANEIYLSHTAWLALNRAEIKTALVGEFALKGVAEPERIYKIVQSQRAIILENQYISVTDLRDFRAYHQSASPEELENLLVHIEKFVRAACEAHNGTIRVAFGDTFIFTFPGAEQALTAVHQLCRQWDDFIQANQIPCSLCVGAHYGQLSIFRLFAYGDDLLLAMGLVNLIAHHADPRRSGAVVSQKVREMVLETVWAEKLTPITWERDKFRLPDDQTAYQLTTAVDNEQFLPPTYR